MSIEELANQAAERVREIIGEAEARARELIEEAEARADKIREAAERDAAEIRTKADAQANSQLERARKAMAELDSALGGLGSGLMSKITGAPPSAAPEAVTPQPAETAAGGPVEAVTADPVEAAAEPAPEETAPATEPPPAAGGDAGARLVAMKMALDGKSREEISERLGAFNLTDADSLLDDVMKRAAK